MNGSVYLIKNSANGKVYVGQTIQPVERRFKQHLKLPKASQTQVQLKENITPKAKAFFLFTQKPTSARQLYELKIYAELTGDSKK